MYKALTGRVRLQVSDADHAFTVLYQQLADRVTRYIAIRVGSARVAEDLAAETFLRALEAMRRGRGGRNPQAWVFGIARHVVADHYRHRSRVVPLEAAQNVAEGGPNPAELTDQQLKLERVAAALEALAPDRAEALALRIFGGLSTVEVAETLGKSPQAVKMLVYRAVQDLQERLEGSWK
jgi:RNA polymerase sigma-70 factor (ECF subfamily)